MEATKEKMKMEGWVAKMGDLRMPVFARTAQDVSKTISNRDSSAAALSNIILKDASMAARVLRIANSPFHRSGGAPICTISRAVVKLGFETIRNITMSVSVIEALVKDDSHNRVVSEMARAFHAANQAQALLSIGKNNSSEDVFVATLLYRLGNMAFWCLPNELTKTLEEALEKNLDEDPAVIEKKVLGFTLQELTANLSDEWALGPVLNKALTNVDDDDPVIASIAMGHKIAETVAKGWDEAAIAELSNEISEKFGIPQENIKEIVQNNAENAAENAVIYGVQNVAALIPLPHSSERTIVEVAIDEGANEHEETQYCEPNQKLQLECLRELATVVEEKPDIHELLSMILEGIQRGIGMDRALFALLTPDRKFIKAKVALGIDQEKLMEEFIFSLNPEAGNENIFAAQMKIKQALLIPQDPPEKLRSLLPKSLLAITGTGGFYSAPIIVNNQSIGLFYADRCPSGRELDQESYDSFKHFSQQASLGLADIRKKR